MKYKEQLFKKFESFIDGHETLVFQHDYERDDVFGFFYLEIENLKKQYELELELADISARQLQESYNNLKKKL